MGINEMTDDPIGGCLFGTAVGDALGLPYEGLAPQRAARKLGKPDRYRFLFHQGDFEDADIAGEFDAFAQTK